MIKLAIVKLKADSKRYVVAVSDIQNFQPLNSNDFNPEEVHNCMWKTVDGEREAFPCTVSCLGESKNDLKHQAALLKLHLPQNFSSISENSESDPDEPDPICEVSISKKGSENPICAATKGRFDEAFKLFCHNIQDSSPDSSDANIIPTQSSCAKNKKESGRNRKPSCKSSTSALQPESQKPAQAARESESKKVTLSKKLPLNSPNQAEEKELSKNANAALVSEVIMGTSSKQDVKLAPKPSKRLCTRSKVKHSLRVCDEDVEDESGDSLVLKSEVDRVQEEVTKWKTSCEKYVTRNDLLLKQAKEIENEIDNLKSEVTSKDMIILELQKTIQKQEAKIKSLEENLEVRQSFEQSQEVSHMVGRGAPSGLEEVMRRLKALENRVPTKETSEPHYTPQCKGLIEQEKRSGSPIDESSYLNDELMQEKSPSVNLDKEKSVFPFILSKRRSVSPHGSSASCSASLNAGKEHPRDLYPVEPVPTTEDFETSKIVSPALSPQQQTSKGRDSKEKSSSGKNTGKKVKYTPTNEEINLAKLFYDDMEGNKKLREENGWLVLNDHIKIRAETWNSKFKLAAIAELPVVDQDLAVHLWGSTVLKERSLEGKKCNRFPDREAKPALTPDKKVVVYAYHRAKLMTSGCPKEYIDKVIHNDVKRNLLRKLNNIGRAANDV